MIEKFVSFAICLQLSSDRPRKDIVFFCGLQLMTLKSWSCGVLGLTWYWHDFWFYFCVFLQKWHVPSSIGEGELIHRSWLDRKKMIKEIYHIRDTIKSKKTTTTTTISTRSLLAWEESMGISLRGKEGIQISICFDDFLKGKEKRNELIYVAML